MDYFETLIGHAQFSVALAGFSSLMLGLARGKKSAVLSAWAARVVVVISMFSASCCVVALGLLSTNLTLSQAWRLSSIVYLVIGALGILIIIWDSRRVYSTGIREHSLLITLASWLLAVLSVGLNLANIFANDSSFLFFYGGLVFVTLTGLLLFIQNIILLSNDPRKNNLQDYGQTREDGDL